MLETKTIVRNVYLLAAVSLLLFLLTPALLQADDDQWRARYWNNIELKGDYVLEQYESRIDYDWGRDAPHGSIDKDEFSVRWERDVDFEEGTYQFSATMDDGMRVWVDDNKIIDSWFDGRDRTITANIYLTEDEYDIKVEYYENGGTARAKLDWERVDVQTGPTSVVNWLGEYFNNDSLSGSPILVRDDAAIDFNWGTGSPANNVSNDDFSVRWRRDVNVSAGTHYFTVAADDGVRLRVNGQLLIDQWHPQAVTSYTASMSFAGSTVATIELEYFEQKGLAEVYLSMSPTEPAQTVAPTTSTTTLPAGLTAVMTEARHLNVRSGPGLDFEPFTALSNGDVVELLGRDAANIWVKIGLSGERTGWVSGRFLTSGTPLNQLPVVNE